MTVRFRCFALASNAAAIDPTLARRRGIDGFVERANGPVVDIETVPTDRLRGVIADNLRLQIEDALRFGTDRVVMILGHRSVWTDDDLIAVDLGILDGAAALPSHPIDRAYPPATVR